MYQPKTITADEMIDDGEFPVFGANGKIGYYNKYNHEFSEVLVTCRGATCGTVNISEPKSWITGNSMVVRPRDARLDRRFLEYLLRGGIDLASAITGAAQPQITRTNLSPLAIRFPATIAEQKRIVAILDEAFEGIAKATANAERNLANARELFVATRSELLTQAGTNSPERPFESICVLQRGFDLPKQDRKSGLFPLVSSSGPIDFHCEGPIKAPGVVVGRSGSVGRTYFVEHDFWPLNTVLYVKEFFHNDPEFVFHLLDHMNLAQYAGGAGVPTLNRNVVHVVPVRVPESLEIQKAVVAKLARTAKDSSSLIDRYESKLNLLQELRRSLLHKAFSGQLTGKEAVAA
jgi:type I restriction enzyme S subunit